MSAGPAPPHQKRREIEPGDIPLPYEISLSVFSHLSFGTFKRKELVFRQGDQPEFLYLILQGRADACAFTADGAKVWVAQYSQGNIAGLSTALSGCPLEYDIKAKTAVKYGAISKPSLEKLLKEDSAIAHYCAQITAQKNRQITGRMIEMATLTMRGQICAEIFRMAKPIGIASDTWIVRPAPRFVDIAERMNTSRETVSRTVNGLISQGVVAKEPGALLIKNPAKFQTNIK